ncbi:hypothetical protein [Legionella hackeliae]|uniref:TIGR02391 family protein n=1 Tax=Legionella hackeliae TaxID=449 RepID=A0A0A8UTS4_LEGHA|nr:hypothetical protein [Legionella hackeliae]KTD14071.1 hypothetical protein Lhac_0554 [Legionella hackeliae]CEK10134.1 protein of unknown function [coiled-coil domain] [Legionella hackeliae]STX46859.1 Uncharacterised protein [Legionella hackeliae]
MEFKGRREQFFNRFGIEYSMLGDEATEFLKNGIKNSLENIDMKLSEEQTRNYCNQFGYSVTFKYGPGGKYGNNIFECITEEKNFHVYLFKLESLFYCNFSYDFHGNKRNLVKENLYKEIKEIFINSTLDLLFVNSKNDYFIMPSGSKYLDEEIVIKVLKFLNKNAHSHFITALKLYSQRSSESYIKSAESVRRTLEEQLREVFNNQKGLESNIKELDQKLKSLSKPNEIKSISHKFFDALDKLFNNHTKHNDGDINEAECELIILQAGLLLKYIDKIQFEIK